MIIVICSLCGVKVLTHRVRNVCMRFCVRKFRTARTFASGVVSACTKTKKQTIVLIVIYLS